MAVLHGDNFTDYGIGGEARMLNGVYAENPGVTLVADPDTNAPAGSIAMRSFSSFGVQGSRFVLPGTRDEVAILGRLWMPELPTTDVTTSGNGESPVMTWRSASNNIICSLVVRTTGAMAMVQGSPNTGVILAQTVGPVVTANAYWHIEAQCDFSTPGSVTFEIRIEGTPVLEGSGVVVVTDKPAQVTWGTQALFNKHYFWKDLVVRDGLGTLNSNFLGTVSVFSNVPTSDIETNWTPSIAGPNYQMINNSPPLDGTEYITAPFPAPEADVYGVSGLPEDVTSVKAVISSVRARKIDGGDGNLQTTLISNGEQAAGVDRPITGAFTYWRDIFELDPDTAAPWTPEAVNQLDLKIDRTV